MLTETQFDALSDDEQSLCLRPPIEAANVKTLVDVAITLHSREWDRSRDYRWWISPVSGFFGAIVGVVLTWFLGIKR